MKFMKNNITNAKEFIIMHGCNAQNKMGSGVALAIKNSFPEAFLQYRNSKLKLGENIIVKSNGKIIVNAITQEYYGNDRKKYASYDALVSCLDNLLTFINKHGIINNNIAIPKIGCGLGGLDWVIVESILKTYENLEIPREFVIYSI